MTTKVDRWKYINRCLVCGTKLKFEKATPKGSVSTEGRKYCEQNHARFTVEGGYDDKGEWCLTYRLPQERK